MIELDIPLVASLNGGGNHEYAGSNPAAEVAPHFEVAAWPKLADKYLGDKWPQCGRRGGGT